MRRPKQNKKQQNQHLLDENDQKQLSALKGNANSHPTLLLIFKLFNLKKKQVVDFCTGI